MTRFTLSRFLFISFYWWDAQQNKVSGDDSEYDAKADHPKFQFCNTELLLRGGYGLTP